MSVDVEDKSGTLPSFEKEPELIQPVIVNDKSHKCQICDKIFKDVWHLTRHSRTHKMKTGEEEKPPDDDLSNHYKIIVKNRKEKFCCKECDSILSTKHHFKRHYLIHTRINKPHKCVECGKDFRDLDQLERHQESHTVTPIVNDNDDKGSSEEEIDYSEHYKIILQKDGKKSYSCKICKQKSSSFWHFKRHYSVHSTIKPIKFKRYECEDCDKCFVDMWHLNRHTTAIHIGHKLYKCKKCPKSFDKAGTLKKHLKVHNKRKEIGRHSCKDCTLKFVSRAELQAHALAHKGVKLLQVNLSERVREVGEDEERLLKRGCYFCSKLFRRFEGLRNHISRHTKEKPK